VRKILLLSVLLAVLWGVATAQGAVYFGVDTSNEPTYLQSIDHQINSRGAETSFLSVLTSSVTESFAAFPKGDIPEDPAAPYTFAMGSVTASMSVSTGNGTAVVQDAPSSGRFPVVGVGNHGAGDTKFIQTRSTQTSGLYIDFSQALTAIGFYATDVGDTSGLVVDLFCDDTWVAGLVVNELGYSNSIFYFGYVADSPSQVIDRIYFHVASGKPDENWGLDLLTIQAAPTTVVPEPAAFLVWVLLGITWAGGSWRLAFLRRSGGGAASEPRDVPASRPAEVERRLAEQRRRGLQTPK